MNRKKIAAALLTVGVPFALFAAPAKSKADAINQFTSGLGTLVKRSDINDPVKVQKSLKVSLKNPDKWSGQPDGTSRWARWRSPANSLGVTEVIFNDTAVGGNEENKYMDQEVAFSADFELSGNPCVQVSDIERGVGKRAALSDVYIIPFRYHPSPEALQPIPPDKHYSSITVRNDNGYDVTIGMRVNRLGPNGCVLSIGLHSTRPNILSLPSG